jgi:hypothetical protein
MEAESDKIESAPPMAEVSANISSTDSDSIAEVISR